MEAFKDFKNEGGGSKKNPKPTYEELYKEHVDAIAEEKAARTASKIYSTLWICILSLIAIAAFHLIRTIANIGMSAIILSPTTTEPGVTLVSIAFAFSIMIVAMALYGGIFVVLLILWRDEIEELGYKFDVYVHAGRGAICEYNKNKRKDEDL